MDRTLIVAGMLTLLTAAAIADAEPSVTPPPPEPFTAVYEAKARVLGLGGDVLMELARADEPDVFVFRNTTRPRGLASMLADEEVECSRFSYEGGEFRPLFYHEDAGDDSSTIRFSYEDDRAASIYKDREAALTLKPDTLDRATEQIAVIHDLMHAEPELGPYRTIERNEYREIRYSAEGTAEVSAPVGTYDTVVFRRQRVGSSRSVLIWYAPKLGWLPVRIEQYKGDKLQVTASLKSYMPASTSDGQARGSVTPRCP